MEDYIRMCWYSIKKYISYYGIHKIGLYTALRQRYFYSLHRSNITRCYVKGI
jgi:hypothetical protein